jgi:hypothetical protein
VAAGTTVTVSSGDAGVTSTVGSPSSDANVLAAGASTTFRTYAQDGYGGLRFPGITGWLNNNISSLSSGGFEQDGRTVDLGQTATIPVTITPSGASGTHVSGTLYLDDAAFFEFGSIEDAITNYPQGDQVAAIPYAYSIK